MNEQGKKIRSFVLYLGIKFIFLNSLRVNKLYFESKYYNQHKIKLKSLSQDRISKIYPSL